VPRLNRLLRLSLAALLLSAWQVALLHPLLHVDAQGVFVHIPGSGMPKAPGDKKTPKSPCEALAAVAACIASAPQPAVAPLTDVEVIQWRGAARVPWAPFLAYRSQAPPSLL